MRTLIAACFSLFAGIFLASTSPVRAAEGQLIVYTSQPNTDAQQTVDAFMQRYPAIKVEWVRDGTPKILARLRAEIEAGQPRADVLLIADGITMEGLKREGRLLSYAEADTTAFDPAIMDPDHTYFSTKLITTGIIYNTRAPIAPKSWYDLTRPELRGLVVMPSPLASGAALIHAATLSENLTGGWSYFKSLGQNAGQASGGNGDVLKSVSGGDKLAGMIVDFMAIRAKAKGAPVEFIFPTEGVSAVTEPVAILKTSHNPDAAKAFVDFLLSPEGQALEVSQGYLAARNGIAPPPGYPPRNTIRIMPLNAAKALANEAQNRDTFNDMMMQ